MQFYPFILVIILNVFVDKHDIVYRDLIIFRNAGFPDSFIDDFVHPVGIIGSFRDFCICNILVKASISHNRVGDSVETGIGCRMIGVKLRQPFANLINGSVRVAVFIEQSIPLDCKAEMIDAISNRVDQVISTVPLCCSVVLHKMESRLIPVFIVAMQLYPFLLVVRSYISVYFPDFISGNDSVLHGTGSVNSLGDDVVHCRCRFGSGLYVLLRNPSGEPRVVINSINKLIKPVVLRIFRRYFQAF